MLQRCTNPSHKRYHSYGGAGVTVCKEWMSFASFLADMGERPVGQTIDRIDPFAGYGPGNCRWATPKQQQRNRRGNPKYDFHGESLTVAEISERVGISSTNLSYRLKSGWPMSLAVSLPARRGNRHLPLTHPNLAK